MTRRFGRRFWVVTSIVSLIVLAVLFLVTPALAVRGIVEAARQGDAAALERRVDFPALRDSLRQQLRLRMRDELRASLADQDPGLAALGLALAPGLIDGAVDVFVTPDAVAAMVQTARAPDAQDRSPAADQGSAPGSDPDRIRRGYGFRDPDTVVVTLTDAERPDRPVRLLVERRNLVKWKLAGVELPPA